MARTLTKINDTQLTNKDKEILAHSKYAFKSITEQSQLGRIDFDVVNFFDVFGAETTKIFTAKIFSDGKKYNFQGIFRARQLGICLVAN